MTTLESHWRGQNELLEQRDIHVHRVDKDTLDDLGKHYGLDIKTHNTTFTQGEYPLKKAVRERDEQAIEEAIRHTGGWKRFKRDAEIYGDFYEKQGYDLWWT